MCKCRVPILVAVFFASWPDAKSLSLGGSRTEKGGDLESQQLLCDWIDSAERCSFGAVAKSPLVELQTSQRDGLTVSTLRDIREGQLLFRLRENAIWSVADAYADRDLGGKLRDISVRAGPGFDVVALAGAVAAERVRRYHKRARQGTAPESAGVLVPSKWGPFARWLWCSASIDEYSAVLRDKDVIGPIQQGIDILVPLLDVAARRAWSAAQIPREGGSMWDDEDVTSSWSRRDLEDVAKTSFCMVLNLQRPPPPFIMEGTGTLVPEPFVRTDSPKVWSDRGEETAIVPLVDAVLRDHVAGNDVNAVLGSPSRKNGNECVWCVATRNLKAGERVLAPDPWQ